MAVFMYQIRGKSLDDFETSELMRLICYLMKKYKAIRKSISQLEEVLPQNHPPALMSYPSQNGIDSGVNTDGQVSDQQSMLDLVNQFDKMSSDLSNNTGSSNSSVGVIDCEWWKDRNPPI